MLVPALAGGVDAMGRWARLSLWKYVIQYLKYWNSEAGHGGPRMRLHFTVECVTYIRTLPLTISLVV
jgi:hypothetical protein